MSPASSWRKWTKTKKMPARIDWAGMLWSLQDGSDDAQNQVQLSCVGAFQQTMDGGDDLACVHCKIPLNQKFARVAHIMGIHHPPLK